MCFGGGGSSYTPPPPPPKREDPEVKSAAEKERKRMLGKKGRKSTMLTGGLGVTDDAPVAKKRLLGQ